MTPPDAFDSPTTRHWQLAEQAYDAGEDDAAAAHAAIVAVHQTSGIINALDNLTTTLTNALEPDWTRFDTPHHDGPAGFTCLCGTNAFARYPTGNEISFMLWACRNVDCDCLWLYDPDNDRMDPELYSGGTDQAGDPPWNVHDLVRHRSGVGQHNGGHSQAEYVAMLQSRDSDDPGWWKATVLRVVNPPAHTAPPIVGQGIRLREGGLYNRVARFP